MKLGRSRGWFPLSNHAAIVASAKRYSQREALTLWNAVIWRQLFFVSMVVNVVLGLIILWR